MAFVILHPQHAEKWAGRHADFGRDLKEHAKKRLPGFACPEWVEVVPELPVRLHILHAGGFNVTTFIPRKHLLGRF